MEPAPLTSIWGPSLWKILHNLTEKIGSISMPNSEDLEKRLWFVLLTSLKNSLPCPMCRNHYIAYYNSNRLDLIINKRNELQNNIRIWLYNLHNNVNSRLGKENLITLDNLSSIYGNYTLYKNDINIVYAEMVKGIKNKWILRDDAQKTIRIIRELISFYRI